MRTTLNLLYTPSGLIDPVYLIINHIPLNFLEYAGLPYKVFLVTLVGILAKVKKKKTMHIFTAIRARN